MLRTNFPSHPFRLAPLALALTAAPAQALSPEKPETMQQALCRVIETSAAAHGVPVGFLTRLIWRESSFRPHVVSPAGAQGVAQFMPSTARERGLEDPFDPEAAIPKAAEFVAALKRRFGNLGLAAAAYNGGPARVAAWRAGRGGLPAETRNYVFAITGASAEDWAEARDRKQEADDGQDQGDASPQAKKAKPERCLTVAAALRARGGGERSLVAEAITAPWGVQLSGNFSKSLALAAFARARKRHPEILAQVRPMVIGARLRSRGARTFYRVRAPAQTRAAAQALCERLRADGGACVVLPS